MNGRLYDPKLHRFLQTDNYVQDPSNTQNYNSYGYVLNNPLKYTDPSGWLTEEEKREEQLRAQRAAEERMKAGKSMLDWNAQNSGNGPNYVSSWIGRLFNSIFNPDPEPTMPLVELDEVVVYGTRSSTSGSNASSSGDEFNWGIPIGAAGTTLSAGYEYADNLVRTSYKTGRNPISWSKLTPKQQAWRTATVLGKNAKYVKYAKVAGVVGTGISVGMAMNDIVQGEGTTIDYLDVGVGSASIGAAIFLASNPVGWAIGAGAAVYFTGRLIYDIYEEVND